MTKKINWDLYTVIDYVLPLYFIVAIIEFYFGLWRLTTIVKMISIIASFVITIRTYNTSKSIVKSLFVIFILYNLFSITSYLYNNRPLGCYVDDLFNYIPAMFYVFIGIADKRNSRSYYNTFTKYCALSMILGLYLYIMTPEWYLVRQVEIANSAWFAPTVYSEESIMNSLRFTSYLSSEYAVIYFSVSSLSISLFNYFQSSNKKYILSFAVIFIMTLSSIISQMRVAMVCTSVILIYYFIRGYFTYNLKKSSFIGIAFVLVSIAITAYVYTKYFDRAEHIKELLIDRMEEMSISKALQGRDFQVSNMMNEWRFPILGHGMGSGGAYARSLGYNGVTDANYYKILFETGLIGILLFFIIIIMTLFRAIKYLKYYLTELIIICFILVSMLGANALTLSYLYILPFWYSVGMVWNKHYLNFAINNKIKA